MIFPARHRALPASGPAPAWCGCFCSGGRVCPIVTGERRGDAVSALTRGVPSAVWAHPAGGRVLGRLNGDAAARVWTAEPGAFPAAPSVEDPTPAQPTIKGRAAHGARPARPLLTAAEV